MRGLTGTDLVLTCVEKELDMNQYAPCLLLIFTVLTEGIPVLVSGGRGLMNSQIACIGSCSKYTLPVGTDAEVAGCLLGTWAVARWISWALTFW